MHLCLKRAKEQSQIISYLISYVKQGERERVQETGFVLVFFVAWYQRSEKQLENEVSDKQKDNDRKFSGRRHYISFLTDFRSDQKLEGFGLSAFQKKSATN